jgi:hypothetical protein
LMKNGTCIKQCKSGEIVNQKRTLWIC